MENINTIFDGMVIAVGNGHGDMISNPGRD